jgi:hypothetical protein
MIESRKIGSLGKGSAKRNVKKVMAEKNCFQGPQRSQSKSNYTKLYTPQFQCTNRRSPSNLLTRWKERIWRSEFPPLPKSHIRTSRTTKIDLVSKFCSAARPIAQKITTRPHNTQHHFQKSINHSESRYPCTIPNVFEDFTRTRIWICGTRGSFRSFALPKDHPQLHIQPKSLAKSTKTGSHCTWLSNTHPKDQVEGIPLSIKEFTIPNLQKLINCSDYKYPGTIPNVLEDFPRTRIWIRGTRGSFRSFVLPKDHPQLRIQASLLAKSTKTGSHRTWASNTQLKDQGDNIPLSTKIFKITKMHPTKLLHVEIEFKFVFIKATCEEGSNNIRTKNDDNGRQPEVPGARPGTTAEK